MKVGDIIINPHVREKMDNGRPNPMYKSMVINIGSEYTKTLRYDGKVTKYYTQNCKKWNVSHHIDLERFMEVME